MQEIQTILVQVQTVGAQLAFQLVATLGLALAWLLVLLGRHQAALAWQGLFALVARAALALGVLWLTVLAVAWPPLLERTGNVLGPMVAGLLAVVLVTEAIAQRLAQSARDGWRTSANVLTALGFSLALALVLMALGWLREPAGAALIDGRYQVTEFADIIDNVWLADSVLVTMFGAPVLLAALAQWAVRAQGNARGTVLLLPDAWQRALVGLGVAGLLGIFWLLSRSVGATLDPGTQTTQTLYDALLTGPGNWVLRMTFVLWLLTLAGLVVSLARSSAASRVAALVLSLPAFTAPVLWCLVCWQLFAKPGLSQVAGLAPSDLVSLQPPLVLSFGLVLVLAVVVLSLALVWRFLWRLTAMAADSHGEAA